MVITKKNTTSHFISDEKMLDSYYNVMFSDELIHIMHVWVKTENIQVQLERLTLCIQMFLSAQSSLCLKLLFPHFNRKLICFEKRLSIKYSIQYTNIK